MALTDFVSTTMLPFSLTASNALFSGVALADVIRDRAVVITAANSSSYLQQTGPSGTPGTPSFVEAYYTLKLDGSLGGEILRRAQIGCPLKTLLNAGSPYTVAIAGVTLPDIGTNTALEGIIEISGSGIYFRDDIGPFNEGLPS